MALGAFFVVAVALSGCGSSVASNAVATVDGNPITLQAYNHWMFIAVKGQSQGASGVPTIVPNDPPNFTSCIAQVHKQIKSFAKTPASTIKNDCNQLFTSLNAQVLDFLVKAYWYQLEARRLHVKLTQKQVMQAFVSAKNQQFKTESQFTTFLSETGQTLNDILFRVRANKLFTLLSARYKAPVTPATIAAYYQGHLSQFGTPENRNLRVVLTKTLAPAVAAQKALNKGQSWATVAKKYSIDPTSKSTGGLLTGVTRGQEETALNNAAFSAPANKIEGPIHGTFGYYVFEVLKITPGTQQTLAQATPLIKQILAGNNQSTEQMALDNIAAKHWKGVTHCRALYYVAKDCGGKPPPTPKTTPTVQTAPQATTTPTTAATGASGTASTPTSAATTPTAAATTPTAAATTPTGSVSGSVSTVTSSTPTATATVPKTTSARSSPKKKK